MQVQQVYSTYDVIYDQERKRIYKTILDNTGKTFTEYAEYYYPLYTRQGVSEVSKGTNIDLKA